MTQDLKAAPVPGREEEIARVLAPSAWAFLDGVVRPFAENRGSREGECGHVWAYQAGVRSAEEARKWCLQTMNHSMRHFLLKSLDDARAVLALFAAQPASDASPEPITAPMLTKLERELLAAARRGLRFIENSESELGITLDGGDALRAAIASAEKEI